MVPQKRISLLLSSGDQAHVSTLSTEGDLKAKAQRQQAMLLGAQGFDRNTQFSGGNRDALV